MKVIYCKLFLAAFFWGGTFVAGRSLGGVVPPVDSAFFRFAIAALLLLVMTHYREGLPRLSAQQLFSVTALGATGVMAYNLFFFHGLTYVSAGRASLIIALNPVFITVASFLIHKEPIPLRRISGVIVSLTGAIIVITHGNPLSILAEGIGRGELLIFGCVLSWTLYSIIGKTTMVGLSPLAAVCYSSVAGAILLFAIAAWHGPLTEAVHYPLSAWFAIAYLGVCGTVLGFYWYFQGIQIIGAPRAAIFINFVPVAGVSLALLVLGERLTWALFTGGALVITGAYLANSTSLAKLKKSNRSTSP